MLRRIIVIIIDIKNQNHKLLTTWDLCYSPSATALSIDFIMAFSHLKNEEAHLNFVLYSTPHKGNPFLSETNLEFLMGSFNQ